MSVKNDIDFFGLTEEPIGDPVVAQQTQQFAKVVPTTVPGGKSTTDRARHRRKNDKETLMSLYTLQHNVCPGCGNRLETNSAHLLSLTFSGTQVYKILNQHGGAAHLLRRIIQAGAPPLWTYSCRSCHSKLTTDRNRPTQDVILSTFGVTFSEWQAQVRHLATTVLLPTYVLRGGTLNQQFVAISMLEGEAYIPTDRDEVADWFQYELDADTRARVLEFCRLVESNCAEFRRRGSGAANVAAQELEAELMTQHPLGPATAGAADLGAFFANKSVPIRSVTRETLIHHYSQGRNACCDCGLTDPSRLRVVCYGGEALEIRKQSKEGFRRLLPRKLAQAHFPGDVKIICGDCHNASMRIANTQGLEDY